MRHGCAKRILLVSNQVTPIDLLLRILISFNFKPYHHRRNHLYLHTLYRRHSLITPCQLYCYITDSYMLANIPVHLKHTGIQGLCTLYCIYTQSAPSRLAGQAFCQLLGVHLLSSIHVPLGCECPFCSIIHTHLDN